LLLKSGSYLFAASSIAFGIDHFLYLRFVARLVPGWIPWHLFWAFFTGIAFIAAGLSIGTKRAAKWAGVLLGTMFLLWFAVLHLPKALGLSAAAGRGAPLNSNEWSSAFIAVSNVWRRLDLCWRLVCRHPRSSGNKALECGVLRAASSGINGHDPAA
jgi:hypothetical protein